MELKRELSRVPALQAKEPEFELQNVCFKKEKWQMWWFAQHQVNRGRWVLGICWPASLTASLAFFVRARPVGQLVSKEK